MSKPTIAELEKLIGAGADVRLEPDGTVVVKQDRQDRVWGELYVDSDGEPHLDCHIHSSVTFQEALDVLLKWVELLQGTINRREECPLHVREKAGKDQGHRRTDVQAL